MLKNKLVLLIAAVILVAIIAGGAFAFFTQKKATPAPVGEQQQIFTLSPEAIGLEVSFRDDNKAMKFTLHNASDITAAEYQISYTKNVNGDQVPEGLIGDVDITSGSNIAGIGYREFGTCSSGVCRYDNVISAITLTLKVSKNDGKVYQVTKTVDLPTK